MQSRIPLQNNLKQRGVWVDITLETFAFWMFPVSRGVVNKGSSIGVSVVCTDLLPVLLLTSKHLSVYVLGCVHASLVPTVCSFLRDPLFMEHFLQLAPYCRCSCISRWRTGLKSELHRLNSAHQTLVLHKRQQISSVTSASKWNNMKQCNGCAVCCAKCDSCIQHELKAKISVCNLIITFWRLLGGLIFPETVRLGWLAGSWIIMCSGMCYCYGWGYCQIQPLFFCFVLCWQ